ncbi:NAD(P)/FAD-dependent oxidoreductase [Natronosalvus vescus]|uniref:NAD(P)/FAD-dependent oxidoreductase n=1 Tax=Natronosalvus vescus TaxID=2953881 RepID=UPI0020908C71|nr:FAD-dependent oxidoreductase [Natronosalvus vescus]
MDVLVLGAGYAGLTLTRLLEREIPDDVDITLVDESPAHLIQHELHRAIRRPDVADEITIPLADAVDRAAVRTARVESVDTDDRSVHLESTDETLEYDVCAICLGAETAFHGLETVREHAIPLKRLHHAEMIRERTLESLERYHAGETAHLVVGGAGLSGIQVAGELAAVLEEDGIDLASTDRASVTLLEQFDTVAPSFPPEFQRAVTDTLEGQGVTLRPNATVIGADARSVTVELSGDGRQSETLPADVLVWTGGIRGPAALDGERPVVRRDLRLEDRTFVVGDAARVVDTHGEAVPASAQSAVREARAVAENVARLVDYEREGGLFEPRLEGFRFESPGWLVSVGDDAVAQVGPSVFTGNAAKALKTTVGVGYLSSVGAIREAVDLVQREFVEDAERGDSSSRR